MNVVNMPKQGLDLWAARQVAAEAETHDADVLLTATCVLARSDSPADWQRARQCDRVWRLKSRADEAAEVVPLARSAEPQVPEFDRPVSLPWWGWCILGAMALGLGIVAAEVTISAVSAQADMLRGM